MLAWITFKNQESSDWFRDLIEPYEGRLKPFLEEILTEEDYDEFASDKKWLMDAIAVADVKTDFTTWSHEKRKGPTLTTEFYFNDAGQNREQDMLDVMAAISYLTKDERILIETHDDYHDYYMHYIFENGFYEEYDGGWLQFDPYDYEDDWLDDVPEGEIPVTFTNLHIDINVDDYNESWALWDCFAPPLSYLLTPNNPPKREVLIQDGEEE
jgi:hypothetical protein